MDTEKKIQELKKINSIIEELTNDLLIQKNTQYELEIAKKEIEELKELKNIDFKSFYSLNKQNNSKISLGINDLEIKNNEAIHDAITYFEKKCPYCGTDLFITTSRKQYEIDHFLPINKGGQNFPWNILPVCQICNRKKRDILPHIFLKPKYFEITSTYLTNVYNKYISDSMDSYILKERLIDLIKKEEAFINRNLNSNFIIELLYLIEQHNLITLNKISISEYPRDEMKQNLINWVENNYKKWIGLENGITIKELLSIVPDEILNFYNSSTKKEIIKICYDLGYKFIEVNKRLNGKVGRYRYLIPK